MKKTEEISLSKDDEKKQEKQSGLDTVVIGQGLTETSNLYASAIAEDVVAYSGKRINADGSIASYQKSHSKINTHKINPATEKTNITQQAGFSAEVNYVTQENKKSIINGKQIRNSRTDDILNADGTKRVNDTITDIVTLDPFGNIIYGSEGQMKFVSDVKKLCKGISGMKKAGSADDLTRYQGKKLLLATEDVERAKKFCEEEAKKLERQANHTKKSNPKLAEEQLSQAKELRRLKENIADAGFTKEQAKAYRLNPIKETAKSIASTAHDAGTQGAKYGAAIGGTISVVTNAFAVYQGNKEIGEALLDSSKDTLKAAVVGYGTAATGAALKGTMEQAQGVLLQKSINKAVEKVTTEAGKKLTTTATKNITQKATEEFAKSATGKLAQGANALSKTNLPALAVTICLEYGSLIRQYSKGEIDGVEFMEKSGEKGIAITASSAMAFIGQVAIPIPVVGAVIGGMIGYTLSSMFYTEALTAFKEAKEAHRNYLIIKSQYEEAKKQRDFYQAELQRQFDEHISTKRHEISFAFKEINNAIMHGDMENFALNINTVANMFNTELQFSNREEFDCFMQSDNTFIL